MMAKSWPCTGGLELVRGLEGWGERVGEGWGKRGEKGYERKGVDGDAGEGRGTLKRGPPRGWERMWRGSTDGEWDARRRWDVCRGGVN